MAKNIYIKVLVSTEEKARLEEIGKEQDRTISYLGGQAVKQFLAQIDAQETKKKGRG